MFKNSNVDIDHNEKSSYFFPERTRATTKRIILIQNNYDPDSRFKKVG